MIPKAAIQRYLTYPRDDHRWIKELSADELQSAFNDLQIEGEFPLRTHQMASVILGVAYPRFSLWLDMGAGKTLTSLVLARYWIQMGRAQRILVGVTSDKAYPTWEAQLERWNIGLEATYLIGSTKDKWEQLYMAPPGLVVAHYPGLMHMFSVPHTKKGRILDFELVDQLGSLFDMVIMDESTRLGWHTSLIHGGFRRIMKQVPIRYALAGRPFGRDPTLLFNQQYLVDNGATFGTTLGMFREALFTSEKNEFSKNKRSKLFKFDKRRTPTLTRLMQHRSIIYRADECVDLPTVNHYRESVPFYADAEAYYQLVIDQLRDSGGDYRLAKNAFLRMRQLSSGFVAAKDDESGERVEVAFPVNPKLELLDDLIDSLPADRKALVWYEYTPSGRMITEMLQKAKKSHVWIWSGNKKANRDIERFMTEDYCNVAIINNKIGAYSLDGLQVANYAFYYESPVSVIDREQSERRIIRDGQKHKIFIYDLLVKGSFDKRILDFHREGADLMAAIRSNPGVLLEDKR